MDFIASVILLAIGVFFGMMFYMGVAFALISIKPVRHWIVRWSLRYAEESQREYLEGDYDI